MGLGSCPVSRPRRRLLAVVALAVSVLGVGCRVDGVVRVEVGSTGAGTVSVSALLDQEALEQLGGDDAVRTEDLEAGGWKVRRTAAADGGLRIEATKAFGSPAALGQVLDEVGGPDGVFRDWTVTVADGFASTTRSVSGRVVLDGTLDQFGDADLAAALDGFPVGRTPEELAALVGEGGDAVGLDVVVAVPGAEDRVERFRPASGRAVDRRITLSAAPRDTAALRWFLLAVVTAALGVVVVGVRLLRPAADRVPDDAAG